MQKLHISLKNGQTLVVANNSESDIAVSEFSRFLDSFRLSSQDKADVYLFRDPVLLVRLSEVAAASVLFGQVSNTETEHAPEVKKRSPRKTSNKSIT